MSDQCQFFLALHRGALEERTVDRYELRRRYCGLHALQGAGRHGTIEVERRVWFQPEHADTGVVQATVLQPAADFLTGLSYPQLLGRDPLQVAAQAGLEVVGDHQRGEGEYPWRLVADEYHDRAWAIVGEIAVRGKAGGGGGFPIAMHDQRIELLTGHDVAGQGPAAVAFVQAQWCRWRAHERNSKGKVRAGSITQLNESTA
ncbi:hypothetical protein [Stenotrophomonas maltophilia]|uniref:hypothetical protein n=1 Tax=Stenotrophomonas maltophilia TaxID=40324 RepID=UPI00215540A0|nr:hypothetical protein [Stenotrophomonas maltophilia]